MNRERVGVIEPLAHRRQEKNAVAFLKEQTFGGGDPGHDILRLSLVHVDAHPALDGIVQHQPEMAEAGHGRKDSPDISIRHVKTDGVGDSQRREKEQHRHPHPQDPSFQILSPPFAARRRATLCLRRVTR